MIAIPIILSLLLVYNSVLSLFKINKNIKPMNTPKTLITYFITLLKILGLLCIYFYSSRSLTWVFIILMLFSIIGCFSLFRKNKEDFEFTLEKASLVICINILIGWGYWAIYLS